MKMETVLAVAGLMGAGLTVVGGFITFNALWQMADDRSQGRPSAGTEWWTLVKGAMLVAVGMSGLITSALNSLTF